MHVPSPAEEILYRGGIVDVDVTVVAVIVVRVVVVMVVPLFRLRLRGELVALPPSPVSPPLLSTNDNSQSGSNGRGPNSSSSASRACSASTLASAVNAGLAPLRTTLYAKEE